MRARSMVIRAMGIGFIRDRDVLRIGDQLGHTDSIEVEVAHIASGFI